MPKKVYLNKAEEGKFEEAQEDEFIDSPVRRVLSNELDNRLIIVTPTEKRMTMIGRNTYEFEIGVPIAVPKTIIPILLRAKIIQEEE